MWKISFSITQMFIVKGGVYLNFTQFQQYLLSLCLSQFADRDLIN